MKVLVLGSCHDYSILNPRCSACPIDEYREYIENADTLVLLDMDEPTDILVTIPYGSSCVQGDPSWHLKVEEKYGKDFDVIIDSISHLSLSWKHPSYLQNIDYLLKTGGLFYGYQDSKTNRFRGDKCMYSKNSKDLTFVTHWKT